MQTRKNSGSRLTTGIGFLVLTATLALSGCAQPNKPTGPVYRDFGPYTAYSQPSPKVTHQEPLHCILWKETRHIHRVVHQILHHNGNTATMCTILKTIPGCWTRLGARITAQQQQIATMSARAYYCHVGQFNRNLLADTHQYLSASGKVASACNREGLPTCLHGYWASVAKQDREQLSYRLSTITQ